MSPTSRVDIAAVTFRALGHPTRLTILERLGSGTTSPVDMAESGGGETLGTIAHHFRRLRDAGLIEVAATEQRRGAVKHHYRLTREGRRVLRWLERL